jgi:hypothetical protein
VLVAVVVVKILQGALAAVAAVVAAVAVLDQGRRDKEIQAATPKPMVLYINMQAAVEPEHQANRAQQLLKQRTEPVVPDYL